MDESFRQWRETPHVAEDTSFVISDSDDDVKESTAKDQIFVIDSSESSTNVSRNITPDRYSSGAKVSLLQKKVKHRIQKFIDCHSDSENNSDHEGDDSASGSDSTEEEEDTGASNDEIGQAVEDNDKIHDSDISDKARIKHEDDEASSESEAAISFAKQEIGVSNIDPLVAQRRALLVCKLEQLKNELRKTKLLLTTGNIDLLPDKGTKLRKSILKQEQEIKEVALELANTPLTQPVKMEAFFGPKVEVVSEKEESPTEEQSYPDKFDEYYNPETIPMKPRLSPQAKELGKQAQATLEKELALTMERLQDLHGSLVARPTEEEKAEDPQGLKVKLMPHQQHALAWLLWREQQKPPGGVLADDMGLGKTLTMISLIIASIAKKRMNQTEESSDDEWCDRQTPLRHKGGTLVVCPASLLSQWENEIKNRCKRGMLTVEVYHGTKRESVPKRLAKNDVVITTYNILSREFKTNSTAYRIHWARVILDEAHIIRNYKSQAAQAACGLVSSKRWALTGTPIQNKETDLYSILKFLQCTPFDDLRVWKRWVDNKNAAGRQRLATVMKTLMLRRTKQELQVKGELESLPEKFVEEVNVRLDRQEQLVYEKVLIYSRTLFAQFLAQRAEKDHMFDLAGGKYDKPTFLSNPNRNTQFTKAQNKLLSLHADVKTHEILVLLLRLRQICVHPSLIHSMLDQEDMRETGLADEAENLDANLLAQMSNIALEESEHNDGEENEKEIGVDHRVVTNLLTSKNPVFSAERISSKMKTVLRTVEEILEKNDKMVIVSQWTSMLNIVAFYLSSIEGASFSMFTGSVPIKERQGIMDAFNNPNDDPRILLLSLTAGGVGLNLVGGNHLLLLDIHWNPQLEVQAQDRVYRFGQKKNVYIYKFICQETIEERIKQLQERKLEIAQNVLTGDKNAVAKLTLNDLKSLFAL